MILSVPDRAATQGPGYLAANHSGRVSLPNTRQTG